MNGISTDSIMAIRNAILQKNAALRDVSSPGAAQVGGAQGTGGARYRPIGLTRRIDEILLSFMPRSLTFR